MAKRSTTTTETADFRTDAEQATTAGAATATLTKTGDGRYVMHVQIPIDLNPATTSLRCRVAAKGDKAPTDAYLPVQARVETPKGIRIGANVFIPLRLLHEPTVAKAVANWREAQDRVKAERETVASEKL
jgi:hypothetical protein